MKCIVAVTAVPAAAIIDGLATLVACRVQQASITVCINGLKAELDGLITSK